MEYRRGDVRDGEALQSAFAGADVVVHLAFLIISGGKGDHAGDQRRGHAERLPGRGRRGGERFVYASSIAAYGFHRDNPIGIDRGLGDAAGGPALLLPGEGRARAPVGAGGRHAPETALYLLGPRSCWARTQSARRPAPRRCSAARAQRGSGAASPGSLRSCRTCPSR